MESERHWYARKSFLLKNWEDWSDGDRGRLECLSQCWSGMHFLGVNYPFKVVEKVREMSFGLPNMTEMLTYADTEMRDEHELTTGPLSIRQWPNLYTTFDDKPFLNRLRQLTVLNRLRQHPNFSQITGNQPHPPEDNP